MAFHKCLTIALATLEFITKLITVTNMFLTSSSIWMDLNSSKDFSNCVWSLNCSFFLHGFDLVQTFESCCYPWSSSIAFSLGSMRLAGSRALSLSLVSILAHSLHLLGILRWGKFLTETLQYWKYKVLPPVADICELLEELAKIVKRKDTTLSLQS
jgi:hypothetical protein